MIVLAGENLSLLRRTDILGKYLPDYIFGEYMKKKPFLFEITYIFTNTILELLELSKTKYEKS